MPGLARDIRSIPEGRPRKVKRRRRWHCTPGLWIGGWALFLLGLGVLTVLVTLQAYSRPDSLLPDRLISGKQGEVVGKVISLDLAAPTENAHHYLFRVDYFFQLDGMNYRGFSYGLGKPFEEREAVTVHYDISNPKISRVAGTRAALIPSFVFVLVLLLFLLGIALLIVGQLRIWSLTKVLAKGIIGEGVVIGVGQHKLVALNGQHPWLITYHFKADGTRSGRSIYYPSKVNTAPCEEGELIPVLFLRDDPEQNTIVLRDDF